MTQMQGVLNASHPYVELYKQAFQIMREKPPEEHDTVAIRLHAERNHDLRHYNLPTASDEVAAIIPGDGSEERSNHHDIILRLRGGSLWRISHLHPSHSSLHYILLFPHGEDGWHTAIPAQVLPDCLDHQMSHNAAIMPTDCILGLESSHCCFGEETFFNNLW